MENKCNIRSPYFVMSDTDQTLSCLIPRDKNFGATTVRVSRRAPTRKTSLPYFQDFRIKSTLRLAGVETECSMLSQVGQSYNRPMHKWQARLSEATICRSLTITVCCCNTSHLLFWLGRRYAMQPNQNFWY